MMDSKYIHDVTCVYTIYYVIAVLTMSTARGAVDPCPPLILIPHGVVPLGLCIVSVVPLTNESEFIIGGVIVIVVYLRLVIIK